ncbi:MAG TPA: hypothetical protein PLH24_02245 [Candidatus Atribacteria bacterium]|nr:hypothetical protein [Candidatus Atribacteria bacterium]HPT63076.1 hypothetical protein [Candidatus Atribacteria bacterium]
MATLFATTKKELSLKDRKKSSYKGGRGVEKMDFIRSRARFYY